MVSVPIQQTTPKNTVSTGVFHKYNRRGTFFCLVFVLGAILYGYDGTYFTGILAMNTFKLDFGKPGPDGKYFISSTDQSLFASIVQVGEVIGALSAGFIGDARGRKGAMQACVALVTLGAVLQLIVTGSIPLLVLGRAVLGIGVGIVSNCTTLYLSEIPPAAIRGTLVSSWQLFLAIGQVIGAGVAQGTKDYKSTFSYRFPIALNILICFIILTGLLFVPESPRWLVSKHEDEKALCALKRIHKQNKDLVVENELKALVDARMAESKLREDGGESRWKDLFKGVQKKKFFGAFGILVCQQIGGVQFVVSYGTVFFESIGMSDAFLVTMITDIVEVAGVLFSFLLVNRIGRRPLLLTTTVLMAIVLFLCGGLGTIPASQRSKGVNTGISVCIILYVFIFNLAWGPLAWVVATEMAAGKNRTKIMSTSTAAFWVSAWAVTFTLPYLYNTEPGSAGLGPKVGYIYGGGTVIAFIFVYFYIPETLGRSLEEINMMIELGVPTRRWGEYKTGVLDAEGMPVRRDAETTPLNPEKNDSDSKVGEAMHVEEVNGSDSGGKKVVA